MSDYLEKLIENYERDLMGNVYSFAFSNDDAISFEIKKRNVPHLLGIGRLPLRQVHGKYAIQLYAMLKNGKITLEHITSVSGHKEVYKKIMNFHHIVAMLHCGEAVKVVKRIGSLNSSYLLYLDHQPTEIVHLGIGADNAGGWYPESLLVLQRNVTAYIDNQLPLAIVEFKINSVSQAENKELFELRK